MIIKYGENCKSRKVNIEEYLRNESHNIIITHVNFSPKGEICAWLKTYGLNSYVMVLT